ncbi:2-hydroxychromene-2-carboxylate isomerase [Mesorhizobium sp. CAU 1732]|uniref:2-hydroxychromene-2-carboxylate isomerase n=1 Tax=Mesorhizobium sp. CAU 1732 TaxID=3140358 RepID=UPI0032603582
MAEIDYYFTSASPWVYLGHKLLCDIATRHGATINVKPVNLLGVWAISGGVAPANRPPVRQRYRIIELQRYAEMRSLPIKLHLDHFPLDPALADHVVAALVDAGADPLPFMQRLFAAYRAGDRDIANVEVLAKLLEESGHDSATTIKNASDPRIIAIREQNTADAIAADAIGVPVYVLNGEPFWGQDRLEMLDRALTIGRQPYSPDA